MIRVFILAGIRLYREGLATMLAKSGQVAVVGTSPVRAAAEAHIRAVRPDIVLLDVCTADAHGLARRLHEQFPDVALVGIGGDNTEIERLQWAEVGIIGYVTDEATRSELLSVMERAVRGEAIFSPTMARGLVRRVAALTRERQFEQQQRPLLTRREREVVALLAGNLSNKEIASRLGIEVATVKNHVHNVLEKFHVHRRSDIAKALASPARSLSAEQTDVVRGRPADRKRSHQ